ncbi:hypothetical protein GCM10023108_04270 [Saccharopolyspora hordei]|uniref:RNA polymerase sigma factor (Sigma-70 family) n=1 Tax=Saccharopolyspora hordei TaxID=1838 RepID=A0A853ANQ2_9PSEU|nr:RNA polymerase sigma factor (sigma-70 family) [Saccharopolyspora hordei]
MGPAAELDRRFEEDRPRLTALAQRVLGSSADAEDAVQDAWVRLSRPGATDVTAVDNLDGWMTRTVSRTCLTPSGPDLHVRADQDPHPAEEAVLAEQVGLALHVVLESLAPPERLAFVLHDSFGMPFREIAEILGRTPEVTRELASRARGRVHAVRPAEVETDPARRRTGSTPSSRRPAAVTSRRSSRCCTPRSRSGPTVGPRDRTRPPRPAVRRTWRSARRRSRSRTPGSSRSR